MVGGAELGSALRTAAFFFDQEALLKTPPSRVEPEAFRTSIDHLHLQTGLVFDDLVTNTGANRAAR